eukprot:scaffold111470_cov28-Prasinocladus_malaysianus.AAC.1
MIGFRWRPATFERPDDYTAISTMSRVFLPLPARTGQQPRRHPRHLVRRQSCLSPPAPRAWPVVLGTMPTDPPPSGQP